MTTPFERVADDNTRRNFDQLEQSLAPILDGFRSGRGSPEGVVAAEPGTVYENKSGGAGISFYVKESGSGNTGWVAPTAGGGGVGPHNLLSATHTDTVVGSPARGALVVGNSTPAWTKLAHPTNLLAGTGYFLSTPGGAADPTWTVLDSTVRGLFSASFPLTYNNSTGALAIYPFSRGGLITTGVLNAPTILPVGIPGSYLHSDGTDIGWQKPVAADVTDLTEAVEDLVASFIVAGVNLTSTYDDSLGTLTLDVDSTVSVHNFLSAQHGDTVAASPTRGDLVVAQGAPEVWSDGTDPSDLWADGTSPTDTWGPSTLWQRKALGASGTYLGSDGTDVLWRAQSTLDHGSIGGLSDDDHAQYLLLAGRSGSGNNPLLSTSAFGELVGSSASGMGLTIKGSSFNADISGGTAAIEFDVSTRQSHGLNALGAATLTAAQTFFQVNAAQTIAMNTGGGMRGLVVGGTYNLTGDPHAVPFLVFNFLANINVTTSNATDLNSPEIYKSQPTVTLKTAAGADVAYANLGTTPNPFVHFLCRSNFTRDTPVTVGSTGTITVMTPFLVNDAYSAGWTLTTFRGFHVNPTGAAIITNFVGHDIEDPVAAGFTLTNAPISFRSLGTTVQMRHAGPALLGATGAPNPGITLDVSGPAARRIQNLVPAAGNNNNVAITQSNLRCDPTGGGATLTGFLIASANQDGAELKVNNVHATNTVTIAPEDANSTAANRILTKTGANVVLAVAPANGTGGSITLRYDSTSSRWREV